MRVTIVTAVLNAADTIVDTLRSVALQSYPSIEHIVVDGGSTDGTLDRIRRSGTGVAMLVTGPDHGPFDAMNRGAARATGDVIGFLNADDVFHHRDAVVDLVTALRASDAPVAFSDLLYVGRADPQMAVRLYRSGGFDKTSLAYGRMPAHPTLYVRRSLFDRLGGFDLAYPVASDFDFCVRLFAGEAATWVHLDQILVRMRAGGRSRPTPRTLVRRHGEMLRACRRAGIATNAAMLALRLPGRLLEFAPAVLPRRLGPFSMHRLADGWGFPSGSE
jgi:glycosyltransferase involved in cell wall biosynthesis